MRIPSVKLPPRWVVLVVVLAVLLALFGPKTSPPWPEEDGTNFILATAELIKALQWPLVALIVALFFRHDIRKLLERMRSFKGPGFDFDLNENLDRLNETTTEIADRSPLEQPKRETPDEATAEGTDQTTKDDPAATRSTFSIDSAWVQAETEVLKVAGESPRAALMLLAAEMDAVLQQLAQSYDLGNDPRLSRAPSALLLAEAMGKQKLIDRDLLDAFRRFRVIRNQVVHGGKGNDEEVLRAIDSGLIILRSLIRLMPEAYGTSRGSHTLQSESVDGASERTP